MSTFWTKKTRVRTSYSSLKYRVLNIVLVLRLRVTLSQQLSEDHVLWYRALEKIRNSGVNLTYSNSEIYASTA